MNLRILSKALVTIAALSVLACGGEHSNAQPGQVSCAGVANCRDQSPVCADASSAVCAKYVPNPDGKAGLCTFRLTNSSSCMCIEGQVQYCSPGAGGNGSTLIQDCVANPNGTQAATWGDCHGLN
jgi:hypothetical protein